MYEKVNPGHPDKMADRIAGAIVDHYYKLCEHPIVAVEVLLGHGQCHIIVESNIALITDDDANDIVFRITGKHLNVNILVVSQDENLAKNQSDTIKCGDNGIFKGMPISAEQKILTNLSKQLYEKYPYDGKYLINKNTITVCHSNVKNDELQAFFDEWATIGGMVPEVFQYKAKINPIGEWSGGEDVDCGCTNRKLGSDMGDAITGGGLHGKDLSKADVSVNVVCHILAQQDHYEWRAICNIGDESVNFYCIDDYNEIKYTVNMKYPKVVKMAKTYIDDIGGFESLAEWGLIR